MNADQLFIETLNDLEGRTGATASEYDLLRASHLLRQLLLDGEPLIGTVNLERRLDIRYTIGRSAMRDMQIADGAVFWAIQDGFDPQTAPPSVTSATLKRDELLREMVIYSRPLELSVRDVIKFLAHVEGGVHHRAPTDDKERALREITHQIAMGGLSPTARSLRAIARVVIRATGPLRQLATLN